MGLTVAEWLSQQEQKALEAEWATGASVLSWSLPDAAQPSASLPFYLYHVQGSCATSPVTLLSCRDEPWKDPQMPVLSC